MSKPQLSVYKRCTILLLLVALANTARVYASSDDQVRDNLISQLKNLRSAEQPAATEVKQNDDRTSSDAQRRNALLSQLKNHRSAEQPAATEAKKNVVRIHLTGRNDNINSDNDRINNGLEIVVHNSPKNYYNPRLPSTVSAVETLERELKNSEFTSSISSTTADKVKAFVEKVVCGNGTTAYVTGSKGRPPVLECNKNSSENPCKAWKITLFCVTTNFSWSSSTNGFELSQQEFSEKYQSINYTDDSLILGAGYSAKVYATTRLRDNLAVAIKKNKSQRTSNKEIEFIEQIGPHPNLISVLSVVPEEKLIIMERAEMSLDDIKSIDALGTSHDDFRRVFLQLITVAQFIQQSGWHHNDLWLKNVVLMSSGEVKLVDFGGVKEFSDKGQHNDMGALGFSAIQLALRFRFPTVINVHLHKPRIVAVLAASIERNSGCALPSLLLQMITGSTPEYPMTLKEDVLNHEYFRLGDGPMMSHACEQELNVLHDQVKSWTFDPPTPTETRSWWSYLKSFFQKQ